MFPMSVRNIRAAFRLVFTNFDSFLGAKILGDYGGLVLAWRKWSKSNGESKFGPLHLNGAVSGKLDSKSNLLIREIREQADSILQGCGVDERLSTPTLDGTIVAKQVVSDLETKLPICMQLVNDNIRDQISQFFGCAGELHEATLVRTHHVPSDISVQYETIADRYHLDINRELLVNLFIAIEDIGISDGPFTYFNKADSVKLVKKYYSGREAPPEKYEALFKNNVFTAEAGEYVLFDGSSVLHRAQIPAPGRTRTSLHFLWRPATESSSVC